MSFEDVKDYLFTKVQVSFISAIKIGRYTIDHKTNNIKEVKTLELQEKVKEQLKSPQQTVVVDNVIEAFLAQVIAEASPEGKNVKHCFNFCPRNVQKMHWQNLHH